MIYKSTDMKRICENKILELNFIKRSEDINCAFYTRGRTKFRLSTFDLW